MRVTCPGHVILLNLIILIIFSEQYNFWYNYTFRYFTEIRCHKLFPEHGRFQTRKCFRPIFIICPVREMRNAYFLVEKSETKRPLALPVGRCKLRETERKSVDWIHLAQNKD
jgi:hypothetical protein